MTMKFAAGLFTCLAASSCPFHRHGWPAFATAEFVLALRNMACYGVAKLGLVGT